MNNINEIINFINQSSNPAPEAQPEDSHPPELQKKEHQNSESMNLAPIEKAPIDNTASVEHDEVITNDKVYKSVLRKITKIKTYPAIVNNKVFNSSDELQAYRSGLLSSRKEHMKMMRKKNIEETKQFLKADNNNDIDVDELEDDGVIYRRGPVKAVVVDNKKFKVPQTSPKDRMKLYNHIKQNKEALISLVKAENDDDFHNITNENLDDEHRAIYDAHKNNKIQTDRTWTRAEFIKFMNKQMANVQSNAKIENNKKVIHQNIPHGLNPHLFTRF
jgi:hypothetical protein